MTDSPAEPVVLGLAGSITSPSRSGALVARVLDLLAAAGRPGQLIHLSDLPADALLGRRRDPALDRALALAAGASILVLGTPIYRASYTGQLKAFFDLLPRDALVGSVCGLIATGSVADHALAIDHGLRPLVASLAGLAAARSVYVTDADLGSFPSEPPPASVDDRLQALAEELLALQTV
ncbi:MAG: NAD(P)H-dependent oxidoreductase, partial [Chloroflexi bacterium]|nr:NAD(P)H-dependent oxidoreductase [Chloroflexota bacterium]